MSEAAAPRLASTVLLFRAPASGAELEVFLVKRHGRSGFMAGAHVFPGGRVDDDDALLLHPIDDDKLRKAQTLAEGEGAPDEALAFVGAAIRETAEECGVLLATGDDGYASGDDAAAVFAALKDGASFKDELHSRGLVVDLEALHAFSWWLTPKAEPKRYDTRFFFAVAPDGQVASHDEYETTDSSWMTPREALDAYAKKEIVLAPPTLVTLEELVGVASLDDVKARAMRPLRQITPVLTQDDDGQLVIAMPGDPLHGEPDRAFKSRTRVTMVAPGRFASQDFGTAAPAGAR